MKVKSVREAAEDKGITKAGIHLAIKRGDIKANRPFPGKTSMSLVVVDDQYEQWTPKGFCLAKGTTL